MQSANTLQRLDFLKIALAVTVVCMGLWLRPSPLGAVEHKLSPLPSLETPVSQMITQKSHDNNGGDQRIVFSEEDKKRIRAEEIFRD
jgi:hypothetical protein